MEFFKSKIYWSRELNKYLEHPTEAGWVRNIVKISYPTPTQHEEYVPKEPSTCQECSSILSHDCTVLNFEEYKKSFPNKFKAPVANNSSAKTPVKGVTAAKPVSKVTYSSSRVTTKAMPTKTTAATNVTSTDVKPAVNFPEESTYWICKFCVAHNKLKVDASVPQSSDVLYFSKKGKPTVEPTEESKGEEEADSKTNPANMDISDILANKLTATKIRAFLAKSFYFPTVPGTEIWKIEANEELLNDSTELYLEFTKKESEFKKAVVQKGKGFGPPADMFERPPTSFPMQVHIVYTDFLGNEFTRVISMIHGITTDEAEAENDMKLDVLIGHVKKETADEDVLRRYKQWAIYMEKLVEKKELKEEDQKLWEEFKVENPSVIEAMDKSLDGFSYWWPNSVACSAIKKNY